MLNIIKRFFDKKKMWYLYLVLYTLYAQQNNN